jgi:hypothetical protein
MRWQPAAMRIRLAGSRMPLIRKLARPPASATGSLVTKLVAPVLMNTRVGHEVRDRERAGPRRSHRRGSKRAETAVVGTTNCATSAQLSFELWVWWPAAARVSAGSYLPRPSCLFQSLRDDSSTACLIDSPPVGITMKSPFEKVPAIPSSNSAGSCSKRLTLS